MASLLNKLLLVWLGGGLGAVARYGLSVQLHHWFGFSFPYGTLGVNVLGCFVMGIVIHLLADPTAHADLRLLVITGILGGFTTFSAFGLESVTMLKNGDSLGAMGYVMLSVVLGLAAVWLGMQSARVWGS